MIRGKEGASWLLRQKIIKNEEKRSIIENEGGFSALCFVC